METETLKFSLTNPIATDDVQRIEHAMTRVDPDSKVSVDVGGKTVTVESWLMPEEFIVAFTDEDLDARIL